MQETILSVLSDKKKSEEGKQEEELELVVPPPCRTRSPAGSRRVTPTKMMDPRMARLWTAGIGPSGTERRRPMMRISNKWSVVAAAM